MNCTPPIAWFPSLRESGLLVGLALAAAASGCVAHAEFVHPDLASFDVQRIGIYNVENSTVYELRSVSFGGVLQRGVFGVPQYDIHSLLHGAIEEALLHENYETVNLGPAPPGAGTLGAGDGAAAAPGDASAEAAPPVAVGKGHDAELHCAIVFWSADSGPDPDMDLRFRIEIYSAADRTKLYAGSFRAAMKEKTRSRTLPRLDKVIRAAVLRAFEDLPPAAVDSR